jgi:hypothetical protein
MYLTIPSLSFIYLFVCLSVCLFVCLSVCLFVTISRAPWMKNVWFWGKSYIIPNVDNIVIGGTQEKGCWDTTPSITDTNRILNDVGELFPALKRDGTLHLQIRQELHQFIIFIYTVYSMFQRQKACSCISLLWSWRFRYHFGNGYST